MKKILLVLSMFLSVGSFAQMKLDVFKKINGEIDENRPLGYLMSSDAIKELPIPKDRIEHESFIDVPEKVRGSNGKYTTITKKQKVVTYEEVELKAPPRYVPASLAMSGSNVRNSTALSRNMRT